MKLLTTIICAAFAALACSGGPDITDNEWHPVFGPDAAASAGPEETSAAVPLEWIHDTIVDSVTGEELSDDWHPAPMFEQGPELGRTAEALSFTDGFGSLSGDQGRCVGPHWASRCLMPKHKFILLGRGTDTQSANGAQLLSLATALSSQRTIWQQDGYLVTNVPSLDQCTEGCVSFHFGTLPSGAPPGAVAVTSRRAFSSDAVSVTQGTLVKWSFADITVDLNALTPQLAGLTSTQRNFLLINIWQHEFGHSSGLGHSGDGNRVLMGALIDLSEGTGVPAFNTHELPSSQERGFQVAFVGDRL